MRDACHPALGTTLPSRAPGPPPCAPLRAQWCARHLASRGPACGGAWPPHPVHALGRGPSMHGPEAARSCLLCRRCQGLLMCGAAGLPVGCSVEGGRRPEASRRREGRSPRTGRPRWTWDQTVPPGTASAGRGSRDPVRGPSPLAPCPCHAVPGRGASPQQPAPSSLQAGFPPLAPAVPASRAHPPFPPGWVSAGSAPGTSCRRRTPALPALLVLWFPGGGDRTEVAGAPGKQLWAELTEAWAPLLARPSPNALRDALTSPALALQGAEVLGALRGGAWRPGASLPMRGDG